MATTLEDVDLRLQALEQEVQGLRDMLTHKTAQGSDLERIARWLRDTRASQAAISAGLDEMFEKMGVPRDLKPISAEELHQRMIAEGINPEDCLLSREIKRMREE